jgi:hypothetical protein
MVVGRDPEGKVSGDAAQSEGCLAANCFTGNNGDEKKPRKISKWA